MKISKFYKTTTSLLLATTLLSTGVFASESAILSNYEALELSSVLGYENDTINGLNIELISRFDTNKSNADGGVIEIVTYNTTAKVAYAVAGSIGELVIIDMQNPDLDGLSGIGYDMNFLVSDIEDFEYGDMSSIAINSQNTKLAVAIQAKGYNDDGKVAIFDINTDGTLAENPIFVDCGKQPDALTFTPDGSLIIVANEGEPREGYTNAVDPEGSVTIITVADNTSQKISFEGVYYDENVLIKDNSSPELDFEPEYIATTNEVAYIALQENNAIAILDLKTCEFTGVYGLGFQNYNEVEIDLVADGIINLENQDVYGIRMPDGISLAEIDGKTYLFTANEGDGREWGDEDNLYVNEYKGTTSPSGDVTLDEKVTWFDPTDYSETLDQDKAYIFGARSFSIFEVTEDGLELTFDSGSDFEEIASAYLADYFNCSNDDISLEDRSGKKGVEPEYAVTGEIDGKFYAFVGLERQGGIVVYDITDPQNSVYVNYINTREFSSDIAGDVAPEGMQFISSEDSPTGNALLIVGNEVSGTLPVFELTSYTAKDAIEKFSDVTTSSWHYSAVEFALENALFAGTSEVAFSPDVTMSKAMLWNVLYRYDGQTGETTGVNWYVSAQNWAIENGISDGLNPESDMTRIELATILYNYQGQPEVENNSYDDDAMVWAVDEGLFIGDLNGNLNPQGNATRAQVATVLMRFMSL